MMVPELHQNRPALYAGEPLDRAQAAMILLHGRGATAEDILSLREEWNVPGFAYLAPQAANFTWYPNRFIAPIESNEPYLTSALRVVADLLKLTADAGLPADKVMLLGFSQGACLALEYAARNPRRYGGLVGLSGGLIGPEGMRFDYPGTLDETPVFLGCSDVDFHIPKSRVLESAAVFRQMRASVTDRLYPNMGHGINEDEIAQVAQMMTVLTSQ
jgi:predicted esterase